MLKTISSQYGYQQQPKTASQASPGSSVGNSSRRQVVATAGNKGVQSFEVSDMTVLDATFCIVLHWEGYNLVGMLLLLPLRFPTCYTVLYTYVATVMHSQFLLAFRFELTTN